MYRVRTFAFEGVCYEKISGFRTDSSDGVQHSRDTARGRGNLLGSIARPTVRSNVLPRDRTIAPAPRRLPSEERSVTRTTPKPAETTPGAEIQSIIPKGDSGTSVSGENKRGTAVQAAGTEADRPVTKKMRWGQADTPKPDQKTEDKTEQKFQWGRQRQ